MLHLKGRRTGVAALAFSHCGRRLAATGSGGVHVWDLHDPVARPAHAARPPEGGPVEAVAFFPDGRVFHAGHTDRHLFDPATGRTVWSYGMSDYPPDVLVPAPDGRRAARGQSRWRYGPPTVWDLGPDGAASPVWSGAGADRVRAAAFAPDGSAVAFAGERELAGGAGAFLSVHAAATGELTHDLPPAYTNPAQLLFAPDNGRLVTRYRNGLAVYDLSAPTRPPKKVANPDRTHFAAAAFHPHGRTLATVTTDRLAQFWDTATWAPGATFTWDVGKLYAVAFSPDGATCAAGSHTGRVLVWDV